MKTNNMKAKSLILFAKANDKNKSNLNMSTLSRSLKTRGKLANNQVHGFMKKHKYLCPQAHVIIIGDDIMDPGLGPAAGSDDKIIFIGAKPHADFSDGDFEWNGDESDADVKKVGDKSSLWE